MDYRYIYLAIRFIENWFKNVQYSISTLDSSRLNNYYEERDEFYYFMEKIESQIDNFMPKDKDELKDFKKFLYLKAFASDFIFYFENILRSVVQLFRLKESSFTPVYDIVILTRQNLIKFIDSIDKDENLNEYDVEREIIETLKKIDVQYRFLPNNNPSITKIVHPMLAYFKGAHFCMLNYLRR